MIYFQFIAGMIMYSVLATASYHETFKQTKWFFIVGTIAAVLANLLWLSIAKADPNSSSLMVKGLIWDAMLMMIYLLIPIFFFEARFTPIQMVGVGLTVTGLFLTKL